MTIRRLKCSHLFPAVRAEKPADAVVRSSDAERAVGRRSAEALRKRFAFAMLSGGIRCVHDSESSLDGVGLVARHVKVALEAAARERETQDGGNRAEENGFFDHDEEGKNG